MISAQAIRGILTRALLLLSLLLAGMVPDGMMRQAGADGMRLVLCTTDGVQEVWLSEDGETTPVDPAQDRKTSHKSQCVQVNLIAQTASIPGAEPLVVRLLPGVVSGTTHQVLSRQVVGSTRRSRAPPYFV